MAFGCQEKTINHDRCLVQNAFLNENGVIVKLADK